MKQSLVKKLTAGILTGALAISVTACGGNSADTNNASTNADVSAQTENSGDVTFRTACIVMLCRISIQFYVQARISSLQKMEVIQDMISKYYRQYLTDFHSTV